jgi:hypothetical protein
MDFVTGLPRTQKGNDSIWVIIDHLTKVAHFIPVKTTYGGATLARIYLKEIVRLHGIPRKIVSDRGTQFTSKFWTSLQKAMGTKLDFSTAYHPQTDGQTERVNKVLEDLLRARVLTFDRSWESSLPYAEFSYNNSHQASIKMSPFEALYGQKCQTPLMWSNVGEKALEGPVFVKEAEEKVTLIRRRLLEAQSRQKSYADNRRRELRFEEGDFVYLKVSPMRGVRRFQVKGKLAPRFVGPYPIIGRVGTAAYRLELPESMSDIHNVFHVSQLRKCLQAPESHIEEEAIQIQKYLQYCRRFETGGSLSRRVSVPRAPAQMGRARGRARRGEGRGGRSQVEREVEIPRPSCSSRAQVGCACSRGLQTSTRVRGRAAPRERLPLPSFPRGQPSLRRPWSFLL